jgi:hypothetical protein
MATVGVAMPVKAPQPSFKPLINELPKASTTKDDFDPEKHICFKEPSKVYTMKDINLLRILESHLSLSPNHFSYSPRKLSCECVKKYSAKKF